MERSWQIGQGPEELRKGIVVGIVVLLWVLTRVSGFWPHVPPMWCLGSQNLEQVQTKNPQGNLFSIAKSLGKGNLARQTF